MADPLKAHVVIVGAGVAGMLAAYRLTKAGVKVLVLEAGPVINRGEALQRYRTAVAKTPESPYPDNDYAPRPKVTSLDSYYVQEGPTFFKSTYERAVGGTTWHWLGTSLRHLPADFHMRSRSLAGNGFVTANDPDQVITIVLDGRGAMPAFADTLANQEIAAVISYIRNSWGNSATVVTVEQVRTVVNSNE